MQDAVYLANVLRTSISTLPRMDAAHLSKEHYFPYFQPLLSIASGRIAGYEALARTRDDNGKVISAGALFSDPAIEYRDKLAIDRHLRGLAIRQFAATPDAGFLTLNISPDWIERTGTSGSSHTLNMIEQTRIDPARIVIEITEDGGDLSSLEAMVKLYQREGLRVAIDDFGAGASQLDRIIALEPDIIKLDMSLFKKAAQGGVHADAALAVTALAQRAGCKIICEGVETEEEFHFGIECGAAYMQGWLFRAALPELQSAEACATQLSGLRAGYLQRKSQRLSRLMQHNSEITGILLQIKDFLVHQGFDRVDARALAALGVIRFFVCDLSGCQISPNYEVSEQELREHDRFVGCNWSYRPYFPMLMAVRELDTERPVASQPYRDTHSLQLCKTFALFLSDKHVLLVDVAVDDGTLFADS